MINFFLIEKLHIDSNSTVVNSIINDRIRVGNSVVTEKIPASIKQFLSTWVITFLLKIQHYKDYINASVTIDIQTYVSM